MVAKNEEQTEYINEARRESERLEKNSRWLNLFSVIFAVMTLVFMFAKDISTPGQGMRDQEPQRFPQQTKASQSWGSRQEKPE